LTAIDSLDNLGSRLRPFAGRRSITDDRLRSIPKIHTLAACHMRIKKVPLGLYSADLQQWVLGFQDAAADLLKIHGPADPLPRW